MIPPSLHRAPQYSLEDTIFSVYRSPYHRCRALGSLRLVTASFNWALMLSWFAHRSACSSMVTGSSAILLKKVGEFETALGVMDTSEYDRDVRDAVILG